MISSVTTLITIQSTQIHNISVQALDMWHDDPNYTYYTLI